MTGLRLAMITRRFWPLVGGAEMVMANLAEQFCRLDASPTILTARWESHWPIELNHREAPVVRLPNPPQRGWGTLRYMISLGQWLRKHRREIDLVYVSMLKHDAFAAVHALRKTNIPVVLRAEGGGSQGDCHWQQTARFGKRIRRRCRDADAIVAPSQAIYDELIQAGYDPRKVHYIANGVTLGACRDAQRQSAARTALAEANPDLTLAQNAPLAVYTGRLDEAKGLRELVIAWSKIIKRWPNAKLWLVGEGPYREALFHKLIDLDLRYHVLLPGAFDNVDGILQAADLFVLPSHSEGMSVSLLEAMAAELPIVATDIPGNRFLLDHEQHALLVPLRDSNALSEAIFRVIDQPQESAARAATARKRVEQEYSLESKAREHLKLFEQLIAAKGQ